LRCGAESIPRVTADFARSAKAAKRKEEEEEIEAMEFLLRSFVSSCSILSVVARLAALAIEFPARARRRVREAVSAEYSVETLQQNFMPLFHFRSNRLSSSRFPVSFYV
jgi:hypothetical protein